MSNIVIKFKNNIHTAKIKLKTVLIKNEDSQWRAACSWG